MAIKYDFYKNPSPEKKESGYHIRPISSVTLTTRDAQRYIENACSLTGADIASCLSALSKFIETSFRNGNRLTLDGLGTFGPLLAGTVKKDKKGDLKLKDGRVRGVSFRPDAELVKSLYNVELTFANQAGRFTHPRNEEEMKTALEEYFQSSDHITSRTFFQMSGLSRTMAYKMLESLITQGVLRREGYGVYVKGTGVAEKPQVVEGNLFGE